MGRLGGVRTTRGHHRICSPHDVFSLSLNLVLPTKYVIFPFCDSSLHTFFPSSYSMTDIIMVEYFLYFPHITVFVHLSSICNPQIRVLYSASVLHKITLLFLLWKWRRTKLVALLFWHLNPFSPQQPHRIHSKTFRFANLASKAMTHPCVYYLAGVICLICI